MKHISLLIAGISLGSLPLMAQSDYTVSLTSGGSWNTVYAQGFSTSLGASPTPGVANGSVVNLSEFDFYKSGNADSAANIQLAIFNTMYPNTVGLSTSSSSFVGLSANTVAGTSGIATGSAIQFFFNTLPLTYGNDYSAVFVNVGTGGSLTPILVSALTANYALQSDGNYHPSDNYGTESQFQYATSSFISGGFFSAYSYAGDANFTATLSSPTPEPGSVSLMGAGMAGILYYVSRRKQQNAVV